MKTIRSNVCNEVIIKNSKFITYLYKVNNVNEVDSILNNLKEEHPKATHYCYAYIINNISKSTDDNEPQSTAGMPMLNVLEKNGLNNILAVTIRYFGGIKLGASGLVRAYSSSVTKALDKTKIVQLEKAIKIEITTDYSKQKDFEYLFSDSNIIEKKYDQLVTYIMIINIKDINKLDNYKYEVLDNNCYIEKE